MNHNVNVYKNPNLYRSVDIYILYTNYDGHANLSRSNGNVCFDKILRLLAS